jgi:hypothetical protein
MPPTWKDRTRKAHEQTREEEYAEGGSRGRGAESKGRARRRGGGRLGRGHQDILAQGDLHVVTDMPEPDSKNGRHNCNGVLQTHNFQVEGVWHPPCILSCGSSEVLPLFGVVASFRSVVWSAVSMAVIRRRASQYLQPPRASSPGLFLFASLGRTLPGLPLKKGR